MEELQKNLSKLALDYETLKYELEQLRGEKEQLRQENEQLQQELRDKEALQSQMRQKLEYVTRAAYTIYERFRAFKARYYETQGFMAWSGGSTEAAAPPTTMVGDERR